MTPVQPVNLALKIHIKLTPLMMCALHVLMAKQLQEELGWIQTLAVRQKWMKMRFPLRHLFETGLHGLW